MTISKLTRCLGWLALAGLALTRPVQAQPAAEDPQPTLEDLAWLAGHWAGTADGVYSEEVWLAPRGGLMLGMHRDSPADEAAARGSGRAFFELLRIEVSAAGIVYRASPGGRSPTDFALVESGPGLVVFANPEHDFPRHIRYQLDASGNLQVSATGEEGGQARELRWTWRPLGS